jgi:hypothetical protein
MFLEDSEWELPGTAAGSTAPSWFLNADLLAEIDEEYRRQNQAFRKFVKNTVAAADHPLRFLLRMKDAKGRSLFDAGHVIPVKVLQKRGITRERLVVEDRGINRGKQATKITGIVKVDGVPVDCASIEKWAKTQPQLAPYVRDCAKDDDDRRYKSQGWYSTDGKAHEFEFVLSLPGGVWARGRNLGGYPQPVPGGWDGSPRD